MVGRIALVFAVAVLVNYPWELAQSPLYAGMDELRVALWHCFIAALGDGVLVLAIFVVGAMVFRRADWFVRPGLRGYGVMFAAGLLIGVLVEWWGLHFLRRWAYAPAMPLIPGLGIGLVPVAQMLLLPSLIFRMVAALLGWQGPRRSTTDGPPVNRRIRAGTSRVDPRGLQPKRVDDDAHR